jgi:hypothetical protein
MYTDAIPYGETIILQSIDSYLVHLPAYRLLNGHRVQLGRLR